MAYLHFLHLLRGLAVSGPRHPMAKGWELVFDVGACRGCSVPRLLHVVLLLLLLLPL